MPNERPSWDPYFLGIADAVSLRGDCCRRLVGAVLVDESHIIRATGYNGSDPGGPSCLAGECPRCADKSIPSGSNYDGCIERHAEDNCLRFSRHSQFNRFNSTMYITTQPCNDCMTLMWNEHVGTLYWPYGSAIWMTDGTYYPTF